MTASQGWFTAPVADTGSEAQVHSPHDGKVQVRCDGLAAQRVAARVVVHNHLFGVEQPTGQRRADDAGAAGDEDAFIARGMSNPPPALLVRDIFNFLDMSPVCKRARVAGACGWSERPAGSIFHGAHTAQQCTFRTKQWADVRYGRGAMRYAFDLLGLTRDALALLNDDRAGRALDKLFAAEVPSVVSSVAAHVVREFGVWLDEVRMRLVMVVAPRLPVARR